MAIENLQNEILNILKENDIKVKLTIPTKFGIEFVLFKKVKRKLIDSILSDYIIQIKDNSIFVRN